MYYLFIYLWIFNFKWSVNFPLFILFSLSIFAPFFSSLSDYTVSQPANTTNPTIFDGLCGHVLSVAQLLHSLERYSSCTVYLTSYFNDLIRQCVSKAWYFILVGHTHSTPLLISHSKSFFDSLYIIDVNNMFECVRVYVSVRKCCYFLHLRLSSYFFSLSILLMVSVCAIAIKYNVTRYEFQKHTDNNKYFVSICIPHYHQMKTNIRYRWTY